MRGSTTAESSEMRADTSRSDDPIARLQLMLDSGKTTLSHDTTTGYLSSVLRALKIPVSSQGLVFSRTSLQTDLIAPWSPRALYFNDDVYVGYVQGSEFLEIATVGPKGGAVFYTLDQEPRARPAFKRDDRCLSCHKSRTTSEVPGFMVLSSVADKSGYFLGPVHPGPASDATPIRNRFGGWYVTGTIKGGSHSGNVFLPRPFNEVGNRADAIKELNFTAESQRTTLKDKFETAGYLSNHSDVVALMVLVHETSVHNTMARVHDLAAKSLVEDSAVSRYYKDSTFAQTKKVTSPKLQSAIDQLVRELMFVGQAQFDGSMSGTSGFAREFAAIGPRDSQGRSLRDFDLETKVFKYPLSFLIYSEGFKAIPDVARFAVYRRLKDILTGVDTNIDFAGISGPDRVAVLQILRETVPEFGRVE